MWTIERNHWVYFDRRWRDPNGKLLVLPNGLKGTVELAGQVPTLSRSHPSDDSEICWCCGCGCGCDRFCFNPLQICVISFPSNLGMDTTQRKHPYASASKISILFISIMFSKCCIILICVRVAGNKLGKTCLYSLKARHILCIFSVRYSREISMCFTQFNIFYFIHSLYQHFKLETYPFGAQHKFLGFLLFLSFFPCY